MAKVKVFVYASNGDADADVDTRAMTLAPRTFSRLAKKWPNSLSTIKNILKFH